MMNLDIKKIYEMPRSIRMLIIGVVAALVFFLLYLWDITDLSNNLAKSEDQATELKQDVTRLTNEQMKVNEEIASLAKLKTLLKEWDKELVNPIVLPDIINEILKMGSSNLLQFTSFNPGAEVKEDLYFKVPIKIEATGSYDQIANFISQVANLPSIVVIEDFTIAKNIVPAAAPGAVQTATDDRLTADFTLDVYLLTDKLASEK